MMEKNTETTIVYGGYIGIMEKQWQLLLRVWVYCFTDLKCWIKLLAWGSGVLSGMRSDVLCCVLRMYFILRVPLAYR